MTRFTTASAAALGLLLLGTACTEPVDCALEPKRCPNRVAAPQPVVPTGAPKRQQLQVPVPTANGQRLLQVPLDPNAAGRQPSREPLAADIRARFKPIVDDAPLPSGAPSREELTTLMKRVIEPARARDFEALKQVITSRLYDALSPLVAKDGDRLWAHLVKYGGATSGGFKTDVLSQEGGKTALHLTLPDGSELRPIVEQQGGVWKIDRF